MVTSIAVSLLASVLFNAGKYGINKVLQKDLDGVIKQAVKDCIKDHQLHKELTDKIKHLFKSEEVKKMVLAFEKKSEIIPATFFEQIFIETLGSYHGKMFADEFFPFFNNRLTEQEKIFKIILLNYEQNILFQVEKKEEIDQYRHKKILQEFESLKYNIEQSRPGFFAQDTAESKLGNLNIPQLPEDFVKPKATIDNIDKAFIEKNVCLLYGSPGSGKSIAATYWANSQKDKSRPVFWFRFEKLLTDKKSFEQNLISFLTNETKLRTRNLNELIDASNIFMVFDDLQYIQDDKLEKYIYTIVRLINNNHSGTKLLCTARKQVNFLPSGKYSSITLEGLTYNESLELIRNTWEIKLDQRFESLLFSTLLGHPQFMVFFKEWYFVQKPDIKKLNKYFAELGRHDQNLQNYLMEELYEALGGLESSQNKIMMAVSLPRIPIDEALIEVLYNDLEGKKFKIELYKICNHRNLIKFDPEISKYFMHDILHDFYYCKIDNKVKINLHSITADFYNKQNQKELSILNQIEGAHHYKKAGKYNKAMNLIVPVTHYCMTHGYYWSKIKQVYNGVNTSELSVKKNLLSYYFNLGIIYHTTTEYDKAIEYYNDLIYICEKYDEIEWKARAYVNLSMVYNDKSQSDKALEMCNNGLKLLKYCSADKFEEKIYHTLGLIYSTNGDWDKAEEFYKKSLILTDIQLDPVGVSTIYNNLGSICIKRGNKEQALIYFRKALELSEKNKDIYGIAFANRKIGVYYKEIKELENADKYFKKALTLSKEIGDLEGIATNYSCIGQIHYYKNELKTAVEFYRDSISFFKKVDDKSALTGLYFLLGNLYTDDGEREIGKYYFSKTLESGLSIGDYYTVAKTYGMLCEFEFLDRKFRWVSEKLIEILIYFTHLKAKQDIEITMKNLDLYLPVITLNKKENFIKNAKEKIILEGIKWDDRQILSGVEAKGIIINLERKNII